ncbi:MAG: hypothetical protein GF317_07880 [Candidatus Lokiarchaeota archaeon]|nr:hypothetical protein [Candidatus Lokiarchaeota archaeon]MBD3199631.1 hypothetical protein [Candidatus Lokiarchaeota archaeon]
MVDMIIESTYFEKQGPENSDKALNIAKKNADKLGIKDIIVASTTGTTAEKLSNYFNPVEFNLVVVTHSYYFTGTKLRQEFDEEKMKKLKSEGLKFLIATHSMSGVERALRIKRQPWMPVDLIAKLIRDQFSQGTKVCIEIATMAVDAGLIPDLDRDIICIGGTGRGADTVCLIKPAPTSEFNNLRVKAIFCKPL